MDFHAPLARAAHRSGAALIAIADSVAAPMVEGAPIMMARSVHASREGCIIGKSRDGVAIVYLLRSTEYQFCNCGVL